MVDGFLCKLDGFLCKLDGFLCRKDGFLNLFRAVCCLFKLSVSSILSCQSSASASEIAALTSRSDLSNCASRFACSASST